MLFDLFKQDPEHAAGIIRLALNLCRLYAALSVPFIPDASAMLAEALNTDLDWPDDVASALDTLKPGHAFSVPENLFAKITDEQREEWQQTFQGR